MPPDPDRRVRPRITLRQIGVLVACSAVAMAVLTSIGRSASGPWEFALEATTQTPYALLIPTLLLVRRGPIKNWMTAALCALPLVGLLAYLNYVAVVSLRILDFLGHEAMTPALVATGTADAMILPALAYFVGLLVPRSCPTCGRPAMLLDPSVPRSRDFLGSRRARTCLACGSRFRRARRGPWVDVDALAPRIPPH